MATIDPEGFDRTNKLLDAIAEEARGGAPSAQPESNVLETVRRLRALDTRPTNFELKQQIWEELMNRNAIAGTIPLQTAPFSLPSLNGHVVRPAATGVAVRSRRWRVPENTRWAVGLLLVLALGGSYFGFEALRPSENRGSSIPAVVAPATPTLAAGVLADDTLLSLTIAGPELPEAKDAFTGIAYFMIPAGTNSTWTDDCCPGPFLEYVLSGSYTVRSSAPVKIYRATGDLEEIPANTEVTLGPGDALLARQEANMEAANNGSQPVELLDWDLIGNSSRTGPHQLPGWTGVRYGSAEALPDLATTPVQLRLHRVTLAADALFTAAGSLADLSVSTDPDVRIALLSDGSIRNIGSAAGTFYVVTLDQDQGSGATPAATVTG